MKRDGHDEMLRELLTGDELSDFRRASLDLGLRAMRVRRRLRHAAGVGAGCALALALGAVLMWLWVPAGSTKWGPVAGVPGALTAPTPANADRVKFISDDELMALFPNRAVALIGKPGHQQFVFLDAK